MLLTVLHLFQKQWDFSGSTDMLAGSARLSGTACSMRTACSVHTTAVCWEKEVVIQSRHVRSLSFSHTHTHTKGIWVSFSLSEVDQGSRPGMSCFSGKEENCSLSLKRPQGVTEKFIKWSGGAELLAMELPAAVCLLDKSLSKELFLGKRWESLQK